MFLYASLVLSVYIASIFFTLKLFRNLSIRNNSLCCRSSSSCLILCIKFTFLPSLSLYLSPPLCLFLSLFLPSHLYLSICLSFYLSLSPSLSSSFSIYLSPIYIYLPLTHSHFPVPLIFLRLLETKANGWEGKLFQSVHLRICGIWSPSSNLYRGTRLPYSADSEMYRLT